MAETTTRSRENTRARLVEAASVVFAESGVEGASVEAICERAGFTRGAFYSNFSSKNELLLELIRRVGEEKLTRVTARVREQRHAGLTRLGPAEIVTRVLDPIGEDRASLMLMNELHTQAMRDPALAPAYLAFQAAMEERVAQLVAEVVEIYGLRLRVPVGEAARLLHLNWDSTASHIVIAGLDERTAQKLLAGRTTVLAAALADPPQTEDAASTA